MARRPGPARLRSDGPARRAARPGGRRKGSTPGRVGIPPDVALLALLYWGLAAVAGRPERPGGRAALRSA
jgi:hypothetical protein